ncbi:histone-arginine methyltransferase CARMER-like isoform X2 [Amphibalanus amphitrite]|uniref:histone-arginine methyltransferase CARMER-like isoform X2 n=1 Tax=Amphibalanus amphitrite TaxID=1232801 RepID=UPI001C91F26E|nr:histone-arginine methyltransferase CARMER-like isoform X2 [Amphibalanus amphitrite]
MDTTYENVSVRIVDDSGTTKPHISGTASLCLNYDPAGLSAKVVQDGQVRLEFPISRTTDFCKVGRTSYMFSLSSDAFLIVFSSTPDCQRFHQYMQKFKDGQAVSVFSERTEEASATQYFQFYSYLSQQQNMMQDYIRTGTYQRAILSNGADFLGKVVLDVGAGSGILSFFAAQAGARKVYAVEASSMAEHASRLVESNNLQHVIRVISGKIEEIDLPEKVDMIISEPMGYMLYNERMLETYLHGKKWLKPGGKMFPGRGDLHIAPFQDEALFMEQFGKSNFWYQNNFHGVNLTVLQEKAAEEYFRQPIVDTFDVRICMAKSVRHVLDFERADERELHQLDIPVEFHMLETGTVHGLAFWFDVAFCGSQQTVWLSTAPTEPLTHWYQVRCLLRDPVAVKEGQMLTGRVFMNANQRQSYDVTITLQIEGTGVWSTVTLDLKNPYFRYTGGQPPPPPGHNTASPSELYWSTLDAQGARQAVNMLNGMTVNGLGEVAMDMSGSQHPLVVEGLVNQAAIHPGSIPAAQVNAVVSSASGGAPKRSVAPTMSSASHLIGGAPSPALMSQSRPFGGVSSSLMIGDYMAPPGPFPPAASSQPYKP